MAGRLANDIAWDEILSSQELSIEESIDSKGFFDITADQIKKFGNREPRLACKHDHRSNVPGPLSDRDISVLAITNGNYRLARTDPFFGLSDNAEISTAVTNFRFSGNLEFMDAKCLSSESKALDAAFISGILKDVFEEDSLDLVVRGRERSGEFEFSLVDSTSMNPKAVNYPVNGVQIEVDGGYEGDRGLHLVEAKIWSAQSSMNIRQLLYPYMHYKLLARTKNVYSYLMFFDSGTRQYRFYRFDLGEFDRFPSWELSLVKDYRICGEDSEFRFESLRDVEIASHWSNSKIPFPQADSFSKVLHLFERLITLQQTEKDELFFDLDITPRQYDYYGSSLCWLGLAEKTKQDYSISSFGSEISQMPKDQQLFKMAEVVYSHDVFNTYLNGSEDQAKGQLSNYVSGATVYRRMSTVRAWTRYFRCAFEQARHLVN